MLILSIAFPFYQMSHHLWSSSWFLNVNAQVTEITEFSVRGPIIIKHLYFFVLIPYNTQILLP